MTTLALPLPQSANAASSSGTSGLALPGASRSSNNSVPPTATAGPSRERERQSGSPSGDEEEDEDEDEDAATSRPAGKKSKKGAAAAAVSASGGAAAAKGKPKEGTSKEYRYSAEIGQMMFVFGEVQDPLPETVRLVEDIVRGQVIEIVTRARLLTHLRSSRYLSAEDLIFLIRNDRAKVNRLRTYLTWKDVRKRAKEDEDAGNLDIEEEDKPVTKTRKAMVKLPWEVLTPFSDMLRTLPTGAGGGMRDDEDDEDEDELQAYHDSMQRLREADEVTKRMTKDEYVHYSDCRQASFTYRKAKRFREFINFAAYLDVKPNDDIVDILGFLAFEMVRSLCVTALGVRQRMEAAAVPSQPSTVATRRHTTTAAQNQQTQTATSPVLGKRKPLSVSEPPTQSEPVPAPEARPIEEEQKESDEEAAKGGQEIKRARVDSADGMDVDEQPADVKPEKEGEAGEGASEGKEDKAARSTDEVEISEATESATKPTASPEAPRSLFAAPPSSQKATTSAVEPTSIEASASSRRRSTIQSQSSATQQPKSTSVQEPSSAPTSSVPNNYPISLFAPPPSARQPLLPAHVLEAFAQIQREQAGSRVGGMRNFRSGMGKVRMALV